MGDMIDDIGEAAGEIWRVMDRHGPREVSQLRSGTGLPADLLHMALGWLAREEKLVFRREGRKIRIELKASG